MIAGEKRRFCVCMRNAGSGAASGHRPARLGSPAGSTADGEASAYGCFTKSAARSQKNADTEYRMAPAFRSRERDATKDDVCALRRSVPFIQQSGLERAAERIGIGQIASSRQRHSLDPASLRSRGMPAREAVQGKCGAMPLTVFGVRSARKARIRYRSLGVSRARLFVRGGDAAASGRREGFYSVDQMRELQ